MSDRIEHLTKSVGKIDFIHTFKIQKAYKIYTFYFKHFFGIN